VRIITCNLYFTPGHGQSCCADRAAIQIPINNLLDIRPPEAVLPGEMFSIDMNKGFKIILYTAVIIRILRADAAEKRYHQLLNEFYADNEDYRILEERRENEAKNFLKYLLVV